MIPHLDPGTRLSLARHEWWTADGVLAGMYLDVYVTELGPGEPGRYAVRGHVLECRWPGADCPAPCVHIEVTGAVIATALAGR